MADQKSRILEAALSLTSEANAGTPALRRVPDGITRQIVERSLAITDPLPFSVREHAALRDVSDFITMAQKGHSTQRTARNVDLLPVGHPMSTAKHRMNEASLRHARASWVSSDMSIKSDEARALVAAACAALPGSFEAEYYTTRVLALPQGTVPLRALVAAFGDGNSSAARRARAMLQRRDSEGKFAWMGGGMSALIGRADGVFRMSGRVLAQGGALPNGDTDTFDIETPDGKVKRVKAKSSKGSKAFLKSDELPDGFSPTPATISAKDQVMDESEIMILDAPNGFYKDENYTGPGERFTDDAYDVIKFDPNDDEAPDPTIGDLNFDKPVYVVRREGAEPNDLDMVVQSWGDVQDYIRLDEPQRDKEEGRKPSVVAQLDDDQLQKVMDEIGDGDADPEEVASKLFADAFGGGEVAPKTVTAFPNAPKGAYVWDVDEAYEPEGRTDQDSKNYTDDPAQIAARIEEFSDDDLKNALAKAVLPSPDGEVAATGYGQLEFDAGNEFVPAEALYEALGKRGLDNKAILNEIYDMYAEKGDVTPGTPDQMPQPEEDIEPGAPLLPKPVEEEPTPESPQVKEEEPTPMEEEPVAEKRPLPALLEGLSDEEKAQYEQSGDYKPFLPKNAVNDVPEGYNQISTEPFTPADGDPDLFDPINLAEFDSEDLFDALRMSLEPGNGGMGAILTKDVDGEDVRTDVPGEAIRDALQLRGESTNIFIQKVYDEGLVEPEITEPQAEKIIYDTAEDDPSINDPKEWLKLNDKQIEEMEKMAEDGQTPVSMVPNILQWKPTTDPAQIEANKEYAKKRLEELKKQRAWIESQIGKGTEPAPQAEIPAEGEPTQKKPKTDVGPVKKTAKSRVGKYYSIKPNGEKDRSLEYTDEYIEHLFSTPTDQLTLSELSDLENISNQVPNAAKPFVAGALKDAKQALIDRANGDAVGPQNSSFKGDVFVSRKSKAKAKSKAKTPEQVQQEKTDAPEADSPEAVEATPEDVDAVLEDATDPVALPTPTPDDPTGVYVATPGKLMPGDIAFKDDPDREYFVVQSVEKKGSKVLVTGYYPGHQPQVKEWKASTPITFVRGVEDLPPSGDKPPLERPFSKNYGDGKVVNEDGQWLPVDPEAREQYLADKKAFEEAKAESGASVSLPVDVDAYDPIPLIAPWKPSNPAFSGDRLKEIAAEAGGDPKKFAELLKKETIYYIDFETSAQGFDNPTPIQVAVYKYTNGELDGEPFIRYMNPGEPLGDWYENQRAEDPSKMLKDADGNPISNEWLATQPDKDQVMKELYEFLGENPIIAAHNMSFESLVLQQQAEAVGVDFTTSGEIDTLTLSRVLTPKMSNKLEDLASRYGIKDKDWHDAAADAEVLPTVLFGMLDKMKPWQAEKVFDIEARDAEFAEKMDKYNSDMEKYKKFAAERAAAEAYVKSAKGEEVTPESVVETATVQTDAPPADASSPTTDGLSGIDTPVPSVVGDQITEAWVTDDENTEQFENVTGSDFKVGDFYGSDYGWSEVTEIEQDPDKENLLVVTLKNLKTGVTKFYRFSKTAAKYKIRRRHGLTGDKEVAVPTEDIIEPQVTEEVPSPEGTTPKSPFDDEFGIDVDMSDWVKDGGQAGSNEGAFYTDPKTGLRYYVKKPKSAKHARNEALASAFYNEAGVRHGRIYIGKDADGNEVLISPLVTGDITELGNTDWQNDPDILKSAQNGFVMDAWLNNWDSVGANYDNMIVKGKDVYRIDPGGALIFRAQGEDKADTLTPEAQQIDDLRFKGKKASSVFGSMTDEEIKEDAKKLVGISPERIEELVDTAFSDDSATGNFIKEMLIARRKTIMDRFGLTEEDFPGNVKAVEPTPSDVDATPVQADTESFVPDVAPGIDPETGGFSSELQQLVDLFIANPAAANDFLNKVKAENPDVSPELVDSLINKVNKPEEPAETEPKDAAQTVADDIIAESADSQIQELDSQNPEVEDFDLGIEDDIVSDLDEILDDETIGDSDKILKRIFEEYDAFNNSDGTFTINSITRVGPDGKEEKLEIQIQKNKGNSFSVIFVQTKWGDDGKPVVKTLNKYAARESFKALNNNVVRARKWFTGFENAKSMSTDQFMKAASKDTYKTVVGQDAIEAVKATHITVDGITELKPGDRVYNWKNGKWGTVDSLYTEYTGQGIHKAKELKEAGEDTYDYTDYAKVRWDNAPGKALPVVTNALFKIDPETGMAVDNPVPTLVNSKGKPKPSQPTKPTMADPNPGGVPFKKKGSPAPKKPKASSPEPTPEVPSEEAPTPEPTPAPEPAPVSAPEPEVAPVSAPEPAAQPKSAETPDLSDEDLQDLADGLAARPGEKFNYKGEDVQIVSVDTTGVVYKSIATGEEGKTPVNVWDAEELDGTVKEPSGDYLSDPNNMKIGDEYTYNASDGTVTNMKLTSNGSSGTVSYQYTDKNGTSKTKSITTAKFKDYIDSGKIVTGNASKRSVDALRAIREIENANKPRKLGNAPTPAPKAGTPVGEFTGDGSTPLPEFSSVEDAMEIVKNLKKSGHQHRITYDGSSIADMEVIIGTAKVDGKDSTIVRFRLQKEDADRLQEMIKNTPTLWSSDKGVLIPERKMVNSGMVIDTKLDTNIPMGSGNTYTMVLADGTQVRFYRDPKGSAFAFGDVVEIFSPNQNFGKADLDSVMDELDIPKESQKYPTAEGIRKLSEKRLLKFFRTGKSDSGFYKNNPNAVGADLAAIQQEWGVTPDDIRLTQAPDGRLELTLPDEVAQKIIDKAGINHIYATTGASNIHNVLGGGNPGMQSSTQRVFGGVYTTTGTSAWSQTSDMGTGGADFIFLRPAGDGPLANTGYTKIVVDALEIVKRLDLFAYQQDAYGAKNPDNYDYKNWLGTYGSTDVGQVEMLTKATQNYKGSPEVMVRHNIPLTAILGYVFTDDFSMTQAIKRLKDVGITEVNGVPVEEFLKTGSAEVKKLANKAKAKKAKAK